MINSDYLKRLVTKYGGLILALVLLVGIFSAMSTKFFSLVTLSTIANGIPDLTVVAVGMTFILILGGIDLSVGSVLALSSAVLAVLMLDYKLPLWIAGLGAIGAGGLCGAANGLVSVRFRIPSFIVTLGMLEIARGGAYMLTNSEAKYIGGPVEWLGEPIPGVLASPAFVLAIVIVLLGQFVLTKTVLGQMAIAIGTNAETVRMSGVRVLPYSVSIFGISGLLCGLASIMHTSRLSTADPNAGVGLELSAIAACVIGGTSLRGGHGSVVSTLFGVFIVSVLQSGLAHVGISDPMKRVITGAVIIIAALVDSARAKRS